ncbi:Methanogenic corrinoid protein MtbC1 [Erythrobacter litoralis]|uniref:Cobalamin B12-binding protein n=2 Tax=Erythrobacter TaxID=1041 RepID=A0A074N4D1_9SPHN|nr:cobalamin-dependent protein [Erythrobacter litoralis]AOL22847.1 Methanogenic corrinoid protein MtbC1 [Erythrobacter litoralis]KEO92852.1 cobalamin B12-binding protein [Erythrobacter litoralis]MEE4338646.1 cobalamin-dependent protein [Erythrobacter sp.]
MAQMKSAGVFGASSAALRKVITNPLYRDRRKEKSDAAAAGSRSGDAINTIIEGEIIPRLMMAHSGGGEGSPSEDRPREIEPADAARFAILPLELEADALLEEIDRFLGKGVSVDAIYLDLLAPSARTLGDMWDRDECDFIDVTMGLWRLQEVMREVAMRVPGDPTPGLGRKVALFSAMPGDVHSFGTLMIEEVFARAGWESEALVKPERRELLDRLSRRRYDLVGLTIARDCPSSALANLIKAMRSVSANPQIAVLVGGRVINENPAMVAEVGADGTGIDARAALATAEKLVHSAHADTQEIS